MINELLRRVLFLPNQASRLAAEIDALHYAVIGSTLFGVAAIVLAGLVLCLRYRARGPLDPNARRTPAPRAPLWAELGLVLGLFGLFVAFWGVGFWQYVRLAEAPAGSYDIYVSGKQWMWKFAYPSGQHSIATLYVPAGRPVRLILTSRDVIHSFYAPAYRIKQDAVPGRYTTTWFQAEQPGSERIMCAEYCGTEHSHMSGMVVALSAPDFERWLQASDGPEPSDDDNATLAVQGEHQAAKYGCLRCHSIDGSAHIGPTWAGLYQSQVQLSNGERVSADVGYLTESMMAPAAKLHRGYSAVMPSYQGLMQASEVGAIVEYIKTLRPQGERSPAPALPTVTSLPIVREPEPTP